MNNIKYSIVYAVIQPELNEQLSVGLIVLDGDKMNYRFSEKKLHAVKDLFTPKEYQVLETLVRNLSNDKSISTLQGISYLSRYSNNLMSFSEPKEINLPYNTETSDWMFTHFVDRTA